MGTLACQADIDVWVQVSGRLQGSGGITTRKNENVCAESCNLAHFWIVIKHFDNGNSVTTRSPGNDPCGLLDTDLHVNLRSHID